MKTYQILNQLFLSPSYFIILFSVYQMMLNGTMFAYLRFGSVATHAFSASIGGIAYLFSCYALRYLPIPTRNLYSLALLITGMHFYDMFWGFGSVLSGNGGFPVVPLMGLVGSVILLIWLDFRTIYLQLNKSAFIPLLIMIVCIGVMAYTGFFHEMSLYSVGLASDPNVGNWWWMLSKAAGLMVFPLLTRRGREFRGVRWWI